MSCPVWGPFGNVFARAPAFCCGAVLWPVGSLLPAPCVGSHPCARPLSHHVQSRAPVTAPCKQERVLVVADIAPALAKGTAGIKPAGEAERATIANSRALEPRMQGDAGLIPETLPQDGGHEPEPPRPQQQDLKRRAGCMDGIPST